MSPTAIETAISKDPKLAALNPQVVPSPDWIAGEVPIAVMLGVVDADIRQAVQTTVLKHMGNIYVPEDVISLTDLDLKDFPRTMAGKIQKVKLAALVRKYREGQEARPPTIDTSELAAEVREIWAKAVGLDPSRLSLDAQIGEFADSITVMRVRDTVRKKTGRTLSLADMASAGTVSGHIELLKRASNTVETRENTRIIRNGPPSIDDMPHLEGDADSLKLTKKAVLDKISPYGLEWDDVEDIIPVYDFANIMVESRLFDSWGFQFATVAKKADKEVSISNSS